MAVEAEGDAVEIEMVVLAALDPVRIDAPDRPVGGEVGETGVEVGELGVGRAVVHPEHEVVADDPDAVVVGVEAGDLLDGGVTGVGDVVQRPIDR